MADFQESWDDFQKEGIRVMAGCVEPLDKVKNFGENVGVEYPLAHSLVAEDFSRQAGAFYDAEGRYLHAAGYIIKPGGELQMAVYSTGPIGRLTASDTLNLIKYYKSRS